MAMTTQTESNNTENVFWVLGRVPMFIFDTNMKSGIFANFGVISLLSLFVCMYISYKAHNRLTKETFLIVSDVDVNMFPAMRSIPSCNTDMNLRSCIFNRHKMRQSPIATIQESLPSHFVISRILWSKPWRRKLSPTTLKTCSVYMGEYPCSLLIWIWKLTFLPILVLYHWYICLCVCISAIKPIIDVQREPSWQGPMLMWTSFLHLGVYLMAQLTSIWKVVFRTVTNCDSHKLRHYRRNLWFVAIYDEGLEVAYWLQKHWKRVMGTWESAHIHFWHAYEKFHIGRFWCYFTGTSVLMCITYKAHNRCTKETFLIGFDVDVNIFSTFRSIPSGTIDINLKVVFWTVTNCDSHKLRHYRRNLWFVAICDQSSDGANWVKQHWKRVLCNWESIHVHFWYEYENLHFCPFWCYFTGISVCVYVYQL